MDTDVVSSIPGYEGYQEGHPPEKIEDYVEQFGKTVISGTPQW